MIARGFRPVFWVAAVGGAALTCYMLSLQVAAERAELASLEHHILQTRQSIRALQTELGTRGRMQQLEQWNAEVLALSAPVAHQFLDSNVSLARFDVRRPAFGDHEQVRLASAGPATGGGTATARTAPASPPASPESTVQPRVRLASAATEDEADQPASAAPLLRRAALVTGSVADAPTVRQAASPRPPARLLDESLLRDLRARSRSEGEGERQD